VASAKQLNATLTNAPDHLDAQLDAIEKRFSPHSLRHGFVTLTLEAGVPLTDVQDAAGHDDPRTTCRYDRTRHRLDAAPTYALAASLAD
jgi:site-specific recombinase XerD